MARDLHAIERARKLTSEARLSDARSSIERAAGAEQHALEMLAVSEADWVRGTTGGPVNLDLQQCLARELVTKQTFASDASLRRGEADALLEQSLQDWRLQEAKVRSSDRALRLGKRKLERKADEARAAERADRICWNWFHR